MRKLLAGTKRSHPTIFSPDVNRIQNVHLSALRRGRLNEREVERDEGEGNGRGEARQIERAREM